MAENAEQVARKAFAGFAAGDFTTVLNLVADDFEWTFLDPSVPDPEPAVCHGREQLAYWMGRDREGKSAPNFRMSSPAVGACSWSPAPLVSMRGERDRPVT